MDSPSAEIVKVLAVNTGTEPIQKERFDISSANPALVKQTILTALNKGGKNAHCLISFRGKLFVADHTAKRGPSTDYEKSRVHYHPFAEELV